MSSVDKAPINPMKSVLFVTNRKEIDAGVNVHFTIFPTAGLRHTFMLLLNQLIEKLRKRVSVYHSMLSHYRRYEFLLILRSRMRNIDSKPRSQHIKSPSRVSQLRQKLHFVVPIVQKPLVKPRQHRRFLQHNIRLLLILHETPHAR